MSTTANVAPDWGINYGIRQLWSEIAPGLWMGGTADADVIGKAVTWERNAGHPVRDASLEAFITADEFDAVVTAYAFARPVDWEVEELRWGFMDSVFNDDDLETLHEAVVWAHRRWKAGKKVLIRCQAGLNRSGLITALVLVRDGMEPQEAISLIRRQRTAQCLNNRSFERLVQHMPTSTWRN